MMQYDQSFSCSVSHSSLERPPRSGDLDHLAGAADTINRRLLIDDHSHVPKISVPTMQPRGSDEKLGLAITQRQEECP
jgi:hypothetical protein